MPATISDGDSLTRMTLTCNFIVLFCLPAYLSPLSHYVVTDSSQLACVREAAILNSGNGTIYPMVGFHGFPLLFKADPGILP